MYSSLNIAVTGNNWTKIQKYFCGNRLITMLKYSELAAKVFSQVNLFICVCVCVGGTNMFELLIIVF